MTWLAALFAVTAALYAMVGFGGGSTYNALLVLAEVDYRLLPSIALVCNLIVVAGGSWRYARAGHLDWRFVAPFVLLSMPMAWLGGRLPIGRETFVLLLGLSLLAAGLLMLFERRDPVAAKPVLRSPAQLALATALGAGIGLLSGLVGIGGGIFLAPLLHTLRLATPKAIAATASVFILLNSLAGLVGQAGKLGSLDHGSAMLEWWPLFLAVLVGGQLGSWLGAGRFSERTVKRLTAVLVLYVAIRLLLT
jgi:uncharacterized membrane protein YfcA